MSDLILSETNKVANFEQMQIIELMLLETQKIQIIDDQSSSKAVSMALQARKMCKSIVEVKKEILEPYKRPIKEFEKIINELQKKLEEIESQLAAKLDVYVNELSEIPFASIDEIRVEEGSYKIIKCWNYEIINENLIPKEYYSLDNDKVKKQIDFGIRNIPGIRIYEETSSRLRIKN